MAFSLFRKKEERAVSEQQRELDSSVVALLSGEETITREQALQVPTVQACIAKISDSISMLPVRLYRKTDGKPEEVLNDSRVTLLNGDTGDTLNTVEFWKAMIGDYYVGRGGWAFIHTSGANVKSLHYVDCRHISLLQNEDPVFKTYQVEVNGQTYYDFKFIKLLRKTKDGYTNIPVQDECSKVISAAYNAIKLEISMSKGSGCKGGFLKSKNKLSQGAIDAIREGYTDLYDSFNKDRGRKILVLNDGVDFQEISSTAAEMQVNENKKTNAVEICKLFGFPHTIIDGGASEEDRRQYIQAVTALINQIETELDKCLLLESEKEEGYYFAFDTKELTRGSQKERYEAYQIGLKNHFLQVDEVRKEEDYEPMGFNFFTLGLGDVLLNPVTREIFTPNTGQMTNLDGNNPRQFTNELRGFNPNQPRESNGRFASTGGSSGGGSSKKAVDNSGESSIIKENSDKPITEITQSAIDRVTEPSSKEYTAEQCTKIQEQHKELLEYSRRENANNEVAFVLSSDFGNRKEFKGKDDSLAFDTPIYGKDLIVMHNHPRNSSFSDTDLKFFLTNDSVKTLTIVKNNGRTEMITKNASFDAGKARNNLLRQFKACVKTNSDGEIDKAIRKFLSKEGGIEWVT